MSAGRTISAGLRSGFRPRRVQTLEGELEVEIPQIREAAWAVRLEAVSVQHEGAAHRAAALISPDDGSSGVRRDGSGTRSRSSRGSEMGVLRGLGRALGGLLAGVFGLLRGVLQGVGSLLRRLV
jgi:hypothetical protein